MDNVSHDFEWRFGDDLPQDDQERNQQQQPTWRRWLPWLLALLLISGSTYAWWRRRQHNLAQAEAEVLQVARLELRALDEGDSELYLSLQDPADRSWKDIVTEAMFLFGGVPSGSAEPDLHEEQESQV